jgi:diguanylate cyclase (GGDEF)-like protein/PAS domain S-box-containing protein
VSGIAASGEEALEGIRTSMPQLVLMDIVLKGDIDGIEVAVRIRNELNIPVIFLSAYTDAKTLDRAKEASPVGYILKPFKERELATMLEMALYKSVADNRIREKEELFSAILNSTTDAIIVTDDNNKIRFLNPEAEQILEMRDPDAKERHINELFSLSDMETGELFQIPRLSDNLKALKARNLRLTNRRQHGYIVELTITRGASGSKEEGTYILSFKDISRLHEVTDTLKYQTSHDTLTGLLNRNELALRMNATLSKCITQPVPSYAIFIDIDHFRVINDSCGTQAGDQLLIETANRIRAVQGPSDYSARYGGDDFVLVHIDDSTDAQAPTVTVMAQNLIDGVKNEPFTWNGKQYPVSISVGIVPFSQGFKTEHDLMIAGTQTVAATHISGGNRYCFHEGGNAGEHISKSISEWIGKIHDALIHDNFRLFYQPILPLQSNIPRNKLEILLRMVDDDGSIIQPSDFIPVAERYNLMPSVDRWVFKKSFEAYSRLKMMNNPLADSIFCVNLSGASLVDENIIGYILDCAQTTGVPTEHFCIEVTESNAILNLTSASRFIHILKDRGFTIALDDFGSGFSSFSYLKNLPVDYLKIDGCFIRNMDRDKVDYNMVQAISSMCRVLGLSTIGEYAENETIIGQLKEIGVDYAQGYGISRPLPLEGEPLSSCEYKHSNDHLGGNFT